MESEFPSNSKMPPRAKDEIPDPKKPARITQGEVIRRKKPMGKKFKEIFVGGDAKGVWLYVWLEVLIPAAKDMVVDAGQEALQRRIYGDSHRGTRKAQNHSSRNSGNYTNYSRYSANTPRDGRREDPRNNMSRKARASHNFDEIILSSRVEAEEVLDQLVELISKYEVARITDLYSMVNIEPEYTDGHWGWIDLRGAGITRTSVGYLLDLPKPEFVD